MQQRRVRVRTTTEDDATPPPPLLRRVRTVSTTETVDDRIDEVDHVMLRALTPPRGIPRISAPGATVRAIAAPARSPEPVPPRAPEFAGAEIIPQSTRRRIRERTASPAPEPRSHAADGGANEWEWLEELVLAERVRALSERMRREIRR